MSSAANLAFLVGFSAFFQQTDVRNPALTLSFIATVPLILLAVVFLFASIRATHALSETASFSVALILINIICWSTLIIFDYRYFFDFDSVIVLSMDWTVPVCVVVGAGLMLLPTRYRYRFPLAFSILFGIFCTLAFWGAKFNEGFSMH
ncbi:MAG: hypothetical protein JO353_06905, partial [Phycisphaerae bacterium]|nr:hypothetical protein [Phycisphaerae bacterium]